MTILSYLDYIVLASTFLASLAISLCINNLLRLDREESPGADLPPPDLDGRDTHGSEYREAILKGGQP
jgi:hypothetical protein